MTHELAASYYSRPTIWSLVKQAFGNGMWNVLTIKITPAAFRWRHFTPFVFVGALAALALGTVAFPWCRPLLLVLMSVYLMAALLASFDIALRSGIKDALILPAVFFALHTAYGVGTWCGLLKLAGGQWGRSDASESGSAQRSRSPAARVTQDLSSPHFRRIPKNSSASDPSLLREPERAGLEQMDP